MTIDLTNLKLLDYIGDVDPRTNRVRISREARQLIAQIATQASQAKPLTSGVDVSMTWRAEGGVFPGPDPTGPWPTGLIADLTVRFYTEGVLVATHTVRGFLTTANGFVHASTLATTLQATTANFVTASSNDSVRVDVTHTLSGAIASASFSSVDDSVAGSTPATIDFGGGGSGGTK